MPRRSIIRVGSPGHGQLHCKHRRPHGRRGDGVFCLSRVAPVFRHRASPPEPQGSTPPAARPTAADIEPANAGLPLFGPIAFAVPFAIWSWRVVQYTVTPAENWVILVTAGVGILITANEYSRNRLWALAIELNLVWLAFRQFYILEAASGTSFSTNMDVYDAFFVIALLANVLLLASALLAMGGPRRERVHPLLLIFLVCTSVGYALLAAGFIWVDSFHSDTPVRFGAVFLLGAVVVCLRTVLLKRRSETEARHGSS